MNKNEKTTSIRFSPDIDAKISWLLDYDRENAKRTGMKPSNRTQIIEEAISEYYYRKINKVQDADVVGRITHTVDDRVSAAMNRVESKIDQILYMTIKNDLGNKLLYRSPNIIPSVPDVNDAMEIIDEESRWDNALEKYMMSRLKKNEGKGDR